MNDQPAQSGPDYDVIVIGGGPAGENAAEIAARFDLRVAVVEHQLVGGECSYWACMPSKALLRPGDALQALKRTPGFLDAEVRLDVEEALERRDALASNWDDSGQVEWLEGVGVELIRGHGRLAGERRVAVTDEDGRVTTYQANRAVVVATGSTPSPPDIDGLDEIDVWDSRDATSAGDVPRRLLVVGGGVVGVEMAQAWKWLGTEEVTIVEVDDHLIAHEERCAGDELRAALERMGVTVHTGATNESLARSGESGVVTAEVELAGGSAVSIEADEVLLATGRRPATSDLGVEKVGLEPGGAIEVDDHLRARDVPGGWLYAVGDVTGRSPLTHTGKYQARIVGGHIGGLETAAWGDRVADPRVVYTSPQVAAVGLTEEQAKEKGLDYRTVEQDIGGVAGANTLGKGYEGTCKLIVDTATNTIVGATFVGPSVGEILHSATIAIVGEVTLDRLWHAIPAFPTLSEVWLRMLEGYRDTYGEVFL